MEIGSWLSLFIIVICMQNLWKCLCELLKIEFNEITQIIKKLEKNNSQNKKNFNKTINKKTSKLKKLVQTEKSIEKK
ncbi:MAG: hypothetical protein Q8742_01965 [Candidatus Phytoplasma australasiaticum]|nr:hypothetical protein [Candidatus Phytoplasma australasiaticum]